MSDARDKGRRQRSRMACEPCRQRKRKCGGGKPCSLCVSYEYECYYRAEPSRRKHGSRKATSSNARSASPLEESITVPHDADSAQRDAGVFARSLESNSGSLFLRSFALNVDPTGPPPFGTFQMLAWNLFLGERQANPLLASQSITELLSQGEMQNLARTYFDKVDPCYGFVDQNTIYENIRKRWLPNGECSLWDAILCGIGAIGCVFSYPPAHNVQTEATLASMAKCLLELTMSQEPTLESATAWILRTVYLRLTARPDEAWMSSCTTLHHIDAVGLHCEQDSNPILHRAGQQCDPDTRRRMFGVARHLNVWLSFDLARSRVFLQNASFVLPTVRPPNDYTTELLELLPYTESLDPGKPSNGDELLNTFSAVLGRKHSQPPSVLAQCNLMLCLYRRLYTLKRPVPEELLEQSLTLIRDGIRAVHMILDNGSPWHHMANVPFQAICTLLAIETSNSFSLLSEAMSCMDAVSQKYQTIATKDATAAARALIYMHQKRKETDVKRQSNMLKLYPLPQPTHEQSLDQFPLGQAFTDLPWFNDLIPGMDFTALEQPFAF